LSGLTTEFADTFSFKSAICCVAAKVQTLAYVNYASVLNFLCGLGSGILHFARCSVEIFPGIA
jgi:hypothetical protein